MYVVTAEVVCSQVQLMTTHLPSQHCVNKFRAAIRRLPQHVEVARIQLHVTLVFDAGSRLIEKKTQLRRHDHSS